MLNEKLGYIPHLLKTAESINKLLIDNLSDKFYLNESEYQQILRFNNIMNNNLEFVDNGEKSLTILISVYIDTKPIINSLSINRNVDLVRTNDLVKYKENDGDIELNINISIDDLNKVKPFLIKQDLRSDIVHELKHIFDFVKFKYKHLYNQVRYDSIVDNLISTDKSIIYDFIYYLYFTTDIEELVKPQEVMSDIVIKKIKNDQFYEFLTSHDTWKTLTKIENWRYDVFKSNLINNINIVDDFLIKNNLEFYTRLKDLDKVNLCLETIFNMIHNNIEEFVYLVLDDSIESDKNTLDLIKKNISRYTDYNKFYIDSEKMFIKVSKKIKNKLTKLYKAIDESIKKETKNKQLHIIDYDNFKKVIRYKNMNRFFN